MFGLRLVSFSVAALLCGTINIAAAPAPVPPHPVHPHPGGHPPAHPGPPPVYHPAYGEVVHVTPSHSTGGSLGTGTDQSHPHVALGHDHLGNVIVAPVTHNIHSDHLKPMMPSPPGHGLGGGVRLDHTVAHPEAISRSHGRLSGKILHPHDVANIQNAKALVQKHREAASAHGHAAQAHRNHEDFHNAESARHFQTSNPHLGAYHSDLARTHQGHAEKHEALNNHHQSAANAVHGPDANAHHHAQHSANQAHGVNHSFKTAADHDQFAHAFGQQGNHAAAHHYTQQAHNARQAANHASAAIHPAPHLHH